MSISNPFSQTYGWKVDPDGRQDRGNGPVITRKMTIEEKIKYGVPVESEDVKMVHMTKETVRRMAASGMTHEEIAGHFMPAYPKMKKSLVIAKVKLYLSDKKLGGRKKKEEPKPEPEPEQTPAPVQEIIETEAKEPSAQEEVGKVLEAFNIQEPVKDLLESDRTNRALETFAENSTPIVINISKDDDKTKISQAIDEMMEMIPENIDRPAHYTAGGIETIDYIQAKLTPEQFEGFCIGAVIKYVSRYRLKGGLEDLKKAAWYLAKIISVKESA